MSRVERAGRCLVLLALMALITFWSGQSDLPIDQPSVAAGLHGFQHRLAHLAAFGLLGLLARWAFDGWPRAALLAVLVTSVFGASDEWHQSFTPGRRSAIDDWLLDTLAAALAVLVWDRLQHLSRLDGRPWPLVGRLGRALAPVAVAAAFALGIALATHPQLSRPPELTRAAVRALPTQVGRTAVQLARSTRDFARQVRSTAAG